MTYQENLGSMTLGLNGANNMTFDKEKLHNESSAYLENGFSCNIKLTATAAQDVCLEATKRGFFVLIVEAGHWSEDGFRPDMNARWDAKEVLIISEDHEQNNNLAIKNITEDSRDGYNAFMITLSS